MRGTIHGAEGLVLFAWAMLALGQGLIIARRWDWSAGWLWKPPLLVALAAAGGLLVLLVVAAVGFVLMGLVELFQRVVLRRKFVRLRRIDRQRLERLEARLGAIVPHELLAALATREPVREGRVVIRTPQRAWDVRTTFILDDDAVGTHAQVDRVYAQVADVLPSGELPLAEDWGGNLYCVMLSGPSAGAVVYWNHEREAGDQRVEPVCGSVNEFYARLVPRTPADAA